jgi:hypothetical protein
MGKDRKGELNRVSLMSDKKQRRARTRLVISWVSTEPKLMEWNVTEQDAPVVTREEGKMPALLIRESVAAEM